MKKSDEIREVIAARQTDLKQLEDDLPKLERLHAKAHEDALLAQRNRSLEKRLELHTTRQQLEAVLDQQESDIDAERELIADLERDLAVELEREHVDGVAAWAKKRTREGAQAFAAAYRGLLNAREAFGEVQTKVQETKAFRPTDAYASDALSLDKVPLFAFRDCVFRGSRSAGGLQKLDYFAERLREEHPDVFKGL